MVASSIGPILVVSGVVTAGAGSAAFLFTGLVLRLAFKQPNADPPTIFFSRHWGLLIFLVGALTIGAAAMPSANHPILIAAAVEKLALVGLIFFGPLKRTLAMTAIAAADGTFALLYLAYVAGF